MDQLNTFLEDLSEGKFILFQVLVGLLAAFGGGCCILFLGNSETEFNSFGLAGACIAMGSIFQAFSYSFYSLIVSVGRQLVVLIPVALFLSSFGEITLIWWAFPIAELMSALLSVVFFRRLYNRTVKTL